jgi:hypothetical protein
MSGRAAASDALAALGPRGFSAVHVITEMHDEVLSVSGNHSPKAEAAIAKIVFRADREAIKL